MSNLGLIVALAAFASYYIIKKIVKIISDKLGS